MTNRTYRLQNAVKKVFHCTSAILTCWEILYLPRYFSRNCKQSISKIKVTVFNLNWAALTSSGHIMNASNSLLKSWMDRLALRVASLIWKLNYDTCVKADKSSTTVTAFSYVFLNGATMIPWASMLRFDEVYHQWVVSSIIHIQIPKQ